MVVVPPLPEQDRILAHLNVHLDRYDRLIAETEFAVARLQEHRQALVTAGVSRGIGAIDRAA
jgi:restriction endonuclease S subunit